MKQQDEVPGEWVSEAKDRRRDRPCIYTEFLAFQKEEEAS